MAHIEVSYIVKLNAPLIQSLGLEHWVDHFSLTHDADICSWPEVFHHIGLEYLAGGELSTYVIDSGGSQRDIWWPEQQTVNTP